MVSVKDLEETILVMSDRIEKIPMSIEKLDKTPPDKLSMGLLTDVLKNILLNQQVLTVGMMNLVRKQRDISRQLGDV